jgi:dipeptidyl aminopeptidase/acylaminoacyl peptidase
MQYWTSKGYAVFFCNPRGSDGKGNGFDDIRGKYGTVDYDDLMTFTDWIVDNVPFVDGDKLAVTGGSYGGYMTNWIIGHTDRFRAAASQRSISNWISKMGISDIGYYFVRTSRAPTSGATMKNSAALPAEICRPG